MPVYTLFGQAATGSSLVADTAGYTLGVQFSTNTAGTITAIWWYSAPTATELPQRIVLYQVSGPTLINNQIAAWSGAAGSGWVRAPFTVPPSVVTATAYKACVFDGSGASFYSQTAHYWDTGAGSGGITSGPLTAPNFAGSSPGQDSFTQNAALPTYPSSAAATAPNYWIDVELTTPATAVPAAGGGRSMLGRMMRMADL